MDSYPISSEGERHHVIHCLEAAIERRTSEVRKLTLTFISNPPFHFSLSKCGFFLNVDKTRHKIRSVEKIGWVCYRMLLAYLERMVYR